MGCVDYVKNELRDDAYWCREAGVCLGVLDAVFLVPKYILEYYIKEDWYCA